ncbi:MAG: hypothetical protein GX095_06325 [Clostridiales bacterium]|nr:hypothetical protein [Clostridiales bacterium]
MNDQALQILEAVKADDIKTFSYLAEQKRGLLSLCFGRFPLLSVCYLYNARKILAEYENMLIQISSYTFVDEEFLTYKKFQRKAKTCLRLYSGKKIITPPEMLAVLNETFRLTTLYPRFAKGENTEENIKRIYKTLHRREPKAENGKLYIKRNKLKPAILAAVVIMIIVSVSMTALPAIAMTNMARLTGDGSPENPLKIFGEAQLVSALEKGDLHYTLEKDITLTSGWAPKNLSGRLDGKGHTIYANGHAAAGFIDTLSGALVNLNIDLGELNKDISDNRGLVARVNSGEASGINVSLTAAFSESASDKDIYLSCFALENYGTIDGCTLSANVSFAGNGEKDVFLAGFAAFNKGTIKNCTLDEGSALSTDTVDVSGIVTENADSGIVDSCVNYAAISQATASAQWNPISGGIADKNYGQITNCRNYGKISSVSTGDSSEYDSQMYTLAAGIVANHNYGKIENCLNNGEIYSESKSTAAYASGIASVNYALIFKSKNDADIKAASQKYGVLAGGITAYNTRPDLFSYAIVENSCVYGKIEITGGKTNYWSFAGGIAGENQALIKTSYSLAEYSVTEAGAERYFFGGIMGYAYNAYAQDNCYLSRDNVTFANGPRPGNDTGATRAATVEEIKALEVYWG